LKSGEEMITEKDLKSISKARLKDAQVLLRAKRFDGAFYLCGYGIEAALKARICRTLRWPDFPDSGSGFKGLQSLKTHDLEILLRFSGIGAKVSASRLAEWSQVLNWDPEKRYQPIGKVTEQQASDMVVAAKRLLEVL